MKGAVSEGGDCWHCPQGSTLFPTSTESSSCSSQPFPASPPPQPPAAMLPWAVSPGPFSVQLFLGEN